MNEFAFRQYCRGRGMSAKAAEEAVSAVRDLWAHVARLGLRLEELSTGQLQDYVTALIDGGRNTRERLISLLYYMRSAGRNELFVHLIGLLSGRDVLPSIAERLEQLAGPEARAAVFRDFELPPLGSPQTAYPPLTQQVIARLRASLPEETCRDVLAGNHHRVPEQGFAHLRAMYLKDGIDAVLAHKHETLVKTLERHLASGEPWFEQIVTPGFVEVVRSNPEMGAGVREGDVVYTTKVPYSARGLDEPDPTMKRYYLCHCPLARESILAGTPVDPLFCYCSGGFGKVPFDVIFGEPVEVRLLESVLAGDMRCRFAILIPPGQVPSSEGGTK